MRYLKVRDPYGTYSDPICKTFITRGKIVAVENVTQTMQARLNAGGLLEVTEADYLESIGQGPTQGSDLPSDAPLALTPPPNPTERSSE